MTAAEVQAIADQLGLDPVTVTTLISALQLSTGQGSDDNSSTLTPEISPELQTLLDLWFPDGNYTPEELKELTLLAIAAAASVSGDFTGANANITTSDVKLPASVDAQDEIAVLAATAAVLSIALKKDYETKDDTIDTAVDAWAATYGMSDEDAKTVKAIVK